MYVATVSIQKIADCLGFQNDAKKQSIMETSPCGLNVTPSNLYLYSKIEVWRGQEKKSIIDVIM